MRLFLDAHIHFYPFYNRAAAIKSFLENAKKSAPDAEALAAFVMLREGQIAAEFLPKAENGIAWFPARQIATKERLELLGLFGDAEIPDGMSLDETLAAIRKSGMIPVLAWGFGKWLLSRAKHVDRLINAGDILICDTAMRPWWWKTPLPMRRAKRKGLRIICGSDPLPRDGQEARFGVYGTALEVENLENLREALLDPKVILTPCGKRR